MLARYAGHVTETSDDSMTLMLGIFRDSMG